MAEAVKREKAPDELAVLIGVGKPGKGPPPGRGGMMGRGPLDMDDDSKVLDPDFEENMAVAFPELEGDTTKLGALQRAFRALMR